MEEIPEQIKSLPKPPYPCWVGCVICIFFPGSAHFLSGQIRNGICWFLSIHLIFPLTLFIATLPISVGSWLSIGIFVIYFVTLIIFSYRPVRKIGCSGWLLFLILLCLWNNFISTFFIGKFTNIYIARCFVTAGQSMSPTLLAPSKSEDPVFDAAVLDKVLSNQWIYYFRSPQRGEIVVYYTGNLNENGEPVIWSHRVVGLPGETLDIAPPFVLINGQKLESPPIFAEVSSQENRCGGYVRTDGIDSSISLPITLGEDEYFLLGDNSSRSLDSRLRGAVKRKDIIGKVIRIYYPFRRAGLVK